MKDYCVTVPIVGYAVIVVEAENEAEAKDRALNDATMADIESWEAMPKIVSGNVFYGPLNEIRVEEQ